MTDHQTLLGGTGVTILTGRDGFPLEGLLGLDVESTYLTDRGQFDPEFRVRTVQFATKDTAWVYDVSDGEYRRMAEMVLADHAYSFCSHTDMDVLAVWAEFGIDISARNVDTRMLAIQADPDNNSDRDLKTLATKYRMPELEDSQGSLFGWMVNTWVEQGKGKRNAKKTAIEEFGWNLLASMPAEEWPEVFTRYAGLDAIACRRLAELLTPDTHMPPELLRVDQWLHVRTTRQRLAGKRIDTEALALLTQEAEVATSVAKGAAMDLMDGVNPGGNKFQPWLAEHGADWSKWVEMGGPLTDNKNPSLDKDHIGLLYDYPLDDIARAVVDQVVEFKKHQDLWNKTRDVNKRLVMHSDGIARIHPLVNPIGATTTARMSSSGPNVQNFSKKDPRMRGLFLPEPGYTFVSADFAQIELRVVAALAREDKMIDVIKAGGDLHDLTRDLLAERGVTISRDVAKMTNFLIVYGGGAKALHDQSGIPMDVAMEVIRAFREQYTDITRYAQYMGMETDAIRTISGRRLPVTRVKGSGERAGEIRSYANVNYAVQSAAREVLVDAWIRLEDGHSRPGIVWLPVHDELVLQVPDDEVDAVIADVEESMTMDFQGVPVIADAVVLLDRDGVSRWMPTKVAEEIASEKVAA
jgi:DNA polymerase-1